MMFCCEGGFQAALGGIRLADILRTDDATDSASCAAKPKGLQSLFQE